MTKSKNKLESICAKKYSLHLIKRLKNNFANTANNYNQELCYFDAEQSKFKSSNEI